MSVLTIRKVGNSAGLTLPKEELMRLNLDVGDNLYIVQTPDGLLLTPYDPSLEEAMELGRQSMKDFRNTYKELAKT